MKLEKLFFLPAITKLLLAVLLVAPFAQTPLASRASQLASHPPGQLKDPRYYVRQARGAYQKKDYAVFVENMRAALDLRPTNQTYMYYLAAGYALLGDRKEALAWLGKGAEMGLVYPADKEEDFASLRDSDEFKAILKKIESNRAPVNRSAVAFTIPEKGLVTEGLAYDPAKETFYVSSVYRRKIISVDKSGVARDFYTDQENLWSGMGMKVDAGRRHLWVASAAHPQMSNYREEDNGKSCILKIDLATGKLLKRYLLDNKPRPHWLGDLVIDARGNVFASDSLSPEVYVIRHGADRIEPLVESDQFASLQGLALSPDEKRLFVADYAKGIFIIDLSTKKVVSLPPAPASTILGIDGLYLHKGSLIAVQNGVNPHRVVRLPMNKSLDRIERFEVLEANNPVFDEPTLGVLVGNMFYYVANSQWGTVDNKGRLAASERLKDPVILKAKL
ncbi:MAG TPA: hypothetical protein VKC34_10730 [Blastocatellia bacterium]|nr:hypothetical protein [Blastocatellia bacterium]